ncbi:hypothetical protein B0H19DRAFT_1140859, partial [Mycena capillaripes]
RTSAWLRGHDRGLYYRAQIGFLTGWLHHVVYIGIAEIAADRSAYSLFLPTFRLCASTLLPLLRSNTLSTLILLATCILFHTLS